MFLTNRFYAIAVATIILLASGNYFPPLYAVGRMLMWLLFIATVADIVLLYYRRHISAYRQIADRLSNGDDNQIRLRVESNCPFGLRLNILTRYRSYSSAATSASVCALQPAKPRP